MEIESTPILPPGYEGLLVKITAEEEATVFENQMKLGGIPSLAKYYLKNGILCRERGLTIGGLAPSSGREVFFLGSFPPFEELKAAMPNQNLDHLIGQKFFAQTTPYSSKLEMK